MIENKVTIVNKAGMHTRPASVLVKMASKYKSEFYMVKDGFEINAKSIIGVMSLAAEYGSSVILKFEGEDEEKAAKEITKFFNDGFGEL